MGVRAEPTTLEQVRAWLRPNDGSLVGANKGLVPTRTWVLKNVQAKATREELTQAICALWAILPVRILSQRKERTTWLVESADGPPSDILQAGKELIFVEEYRQRRPQDPLTQSDPWAAYEKSERRPPGPDMVGTELEIPEVLMPAYHEARLMMAQVAHKDSTRSFRVLVYYEVAGAYGQNAQETMTILEALTERQDVATVVAGDFNIPHSHPVWTEISEQGLWRDPHGRGEEQEPMYTCWPPNGEPSKLDYILVNAFFVAENGLVGVQTDSSLPTHAPLYFETPVHIRDLQIVVLPRQFPRRYTPNPL